MKSGGSWLRSPAFDLGFIVAPPLLAALAVLSFGFLRAPETPVWGWVVLVVCVDVAHVYASIYRTYFDPKELRRRAALYVNVPVACWAAGVLLYRHSPLFFWRTLAYVAVFHFIRQQYGFMRIYQHLQGLRSRLDDVLDQAALYGAMLYPLAFWHATPGRRFVWFVAGDFARLPAVAAKLAGWAYAAALAAFFARQVQMYARHGRLNWGKVGIVSTTAVSWYVGIVALNSDFAFTATNVLAHGIPYFALVWLYGHRKWGGAPSWRGLLHRPAAWLLFLLPLIGLAYFEEGLWDVLVWKEHVSVFAGLALSWEPSSAALALLVPLLALPQSTHYVLDAWIWKLDGSNPDLRRSLFGDGGLTAIRQ